MNRGDVRMVEGGQQLRFALEARNALRIAAERVGKDLDRDVAPELGVARPVDFAHPTHSERGENFVRSEAHAGP